MDTNTDLTAIDIEALRKEVDAMPPEEVREKAISIRAAEKKNARSATAKKANAKQRTKKKLIKDKADQLGLFPEVEAEAEKLVSTEYLAPKRSVVEFINPKERE